MHPGDGEVYGTDLAPYESDEETLSPVNRWRYRVFTDAGFSEIDAHRLAISSADVHKTIGALENGCSLELAVQIFT